MDDDIPGVDNDNESQDEFEPEDNNPNQQPAPLRRSSQVKRPVTRLRATMTGQTYDEVNHINAQSVEQLTTYTQEIALVAARIIIDINDKAINGVNFLQVFGIEKGIKGFGDKGAEATHVEISQMHVRECFQPINVNELTPD